MLERNSRETAVAQSLASLRSDEEVARVLTGSVAAEGHRPGGARARRGTPRAL